LFPTECARGLRNIVGCRGANNEGVTVPVSSLKKYRPPPIAERRRGRR
jgi:hypothetical protein